MTKQVSFTLENPITMTRKFFAKRQISKLEKQIETRQTKILKLQAKFFQAKTPAQKQEVITQTKTVLDNTEILKAKMMTLDNKIIAKTNNKNSNLHLDKGRIDEVIEMLEKNPTKDLVVSTKNGKTRVFLNSPNPLKISRVIKYLRNHGNYELVIQ